MFKSENINGTYYQIYYPSSVDPDNVNPNTQVAIYMHGGGGQTSGGNGAVNCLTNGTNTNSIIIIPNNSDRNNQSFYNDVVNVYDNFISENGINQNNLVISGFSNGYRSTFGILDSYLEKHPNSDPASVYLVETYVQSDGIIYQYNYDAYKKNGTMFYSYTGRYGSGSNYSSLDVTYNDILNPLDSNGCKVVNILEGRVVGHNGSEQVFFQDGIIDFSKGALTLSGDKYTYQIRNSQTGLWEEVNVNDINTLEKMNKRFGITTLPMITDDTYFTNLNYLTSLKLRDETISTDSDVFLGQIGNMYNVIKSSTFVANGYVSSAGGSSTTKVPSAIPDVINKYFSSTSNLLCSLGVFLKKCEESNMLMEGTENDIKKDTEKLKDYGVVKLGNTGTISGGVSTASSGSFKSNVSSTQPANSSSTPASSYPSSGSSSGTTVDTSQYISSEDSSNWREYFPDYDKLYTTNDKVVFDCNNEYRVIVHRDGETITGVEYYYNFGNNESATNALFKIKSMYENSDVENIMVKDGYVKVIFNDSMFNGLSISEFRNKFSNLKEITRV